MSDAAVIEWAVSQGYGSLREAYRSRIGILIFLARLITAVLFGIAAVAALMGHDLESVFIPFLFLPALAAFLLALMRWSFETYGAISVGVMYLIIWGGPKGEIGAVGIVLASLFCGLLVAVLVNQVRAFSRSIVRVVYVFKHGVVVEGPEGVLGIPWKRVTGLLGGTTQFTINGSTVRTDHDYLVVRDDGVSLPLHSTAAVRIEQINKAWKEIQAHCAPFLLARATAELEARGGVQFGSLTITDEGIESASPHRFHPWEWISSIKLSAGYLTIRSVKGGPWPKATTSVSAKSVCNLDTFMTLSLQFCPDLAE